MARTVSTLENIVTGERTVIIAGDCVFGGGHYSVEVPELAWMDYKGGMLVQNAFPDLSPDDREWIISGISPRWWVATSSGVTREDS